MESFWANGLQFGFVKTHTMPKGEKVVYYKCLTMPACKLRHFPDKGVWYPMRDTGHNRQRRVGATEGYSVAKDAVDAWQAEDHAQRQHTRSGPQQWAPQRAGTGGRQQPAVPAQQHQHHHFFYQHPAALAFATSFINPSFGFPVPHTFQPTHGPLSSAAQPAYGFINSAAMGQQAYQDYWTMQQQQQKQDQYQYPHQQQDTSRAGTRHFAVAGPQAQALSCSVDTQDEGTAAQEVPAVVSPSANAMLENLRMRLQACAAQQGNAAAAGQGSSHQQVQMDKAQAELAAQATSSGGSSSSGQPDLAAAPSMHLAADDKEPAGAGPGLWCSHDTLSGGLSGQQQDQELPYANSSCLQAGAGISSMAAGGAASAPTSLAGSSAMSDDLAMNGPWDGLASRLAAATNPSLLSGSGGLDDRSRPTVGTSQPPTTISVEPSQGIQSAAATAGPVEEEDLEPPINLPPLCSSFAASPGTAAGDDLAIAARHDRVTSAARLSSSGGLGAAPPVGTSQPPTTISVEPSQGIESAAAAAEPVQEEDEELLPTMDLAAMWSGFGAAVHNSGLTSPAASPCSAFLTPPPAAFAACFSGAVGPAANQELTCSVVQMGSPCFSKSVSVLGPQHVHRYDNTTPISTFAGATPSLPRSTPLQDADMDDLLPGADMHDEGCPGWLQDVDVDCSLVNMGASLAALQQSTP